MVGATLALGGLRAAIVSEHEEVVDLVRGRYETFLSVGVPDWRIEVASTLPRSAPPADDVVVTPTDTPGRFLVGRYDFTATVDLEERRARVGFDDLDELSFDSFLRVVCSLALTEAAGVMLHASSLVRRERAHVFCGPSGAGKTTIARLSTDAETLTDELSIVRTAGGRGVSYGTPFWGELGPGGRDHAAPLAAIFFPRQADRHGLRPVRPGEALTRLLPNVLFFARDAGLTARVVDVAAALVEAVPCFELAFRRDPGFWEVIDRG